MGHGAHITHLKSESHRTHQSLYILILFFYPLFSAPESGYPHLTFNVTGHGAISWHSSNRRQEAHPLSYSKITLEKQMLTVIRQ